MSKQLLRCGALNGQAVASRSKASSKANGGILGLGFAFAWPVEVAHYTAAPCRTGMTVRTAPPTPFIPLYSAVILVL